MHTRFPLFCRFFLCLSILFLLIPATGLSQPGTPEEPGPGATGQPAGDLEPSEANQEAVEKLRGMSDEEIRALDKKLAEALVLYYDRDFVRALPIFREIADKVETMDLLFWMGTSARELGQMQLAVEKFQKMLAIAPKLHRVRLELATTYFAMGRYDEARRELEIVQAALPPPPATVVKNIEKLLVAIEERTRKVFWNLRLSQGILWSDNIGAAPDQRELAVLNGTLTLDAESSKLRDEAAITNAIGNVLYDMGERNGLMWNTTVSFYNMAYFDYSQFNFMAMDVATGPWWAGRRDVLKVPMGYTEKEYGSDRLSHVFHADPNYEFFFNPYVSLKGLYSFSNENYYATQNSDLDNNKHRFELTPNLYLGNRKHILSAVVGFENVNADAGRFSYDGPVYGISYFAGLPTLTEIFFQYQWTQRDYNGKALPFYDKYRQDKRHSVTAVVSQGFFSNFFASVAFNYIDNASNAELYDFVQTTYTLSVGCKF